MYGDDGIPVPQFINSKTYLRGKENVDLGIAKGVAIE